MTKKSFFEKRSPKDMQRELSMKRVNWQRGLVDKIYGLTDNEGIILMSPLIPQRFLGRGQNQAADSRKNYKWGEFLPIVQPQTQEEAFNSDIYSPLIGRMQAFDKIRGTDERDIHYLGISFKPVQGNDRRLRMVPFDSVIEAVNILDYAHSVGTGIEINPKYTDARIVQREGGQVICKVPSRTAKSNKYQLALRHVPLIAGREENAVVLSLDTNFVGPETGRETFLHDLRYAHGERMTSDRIVFGPHEIAAYFETIRKNWKGIDATVPLRMNPFPIPSKEFFEYGRKLDNNFLIYDPTIEAKDKLRNLHLDEKSMLLTRAVAVRGPWETVYWNPKRDGPLVKYRGD